MYIIPICKILLNVFFKSYHKSSIYLLFFFLCIGSRYGSFKSYIVDSRYLYYINVGDLNVIAILLESNAYAGMLFAVFITNIMRFRP